MATAAEQKRRDEQAAAKEEATKKEATKDSGQEKSPGISQPTVDGAPDLATATDALGIDRIVPAGVQDGWEPAPVEPDEDAVKRAKERNDKQEEEAEARREGRVDPVSGRLLSKDEHAKAQAERKDAEK